MLNTLETMLYVIDLFCGAGGFSEGAKQAGATVVLAVDCWKDAIDVHNANHPECEHWCEELGGNVGEFAGRVRSLIDMRVPPGGRVHIHASPPCQNLSSANHKRKEDTGLFLVTWTLQVIHALSPDTHTLEQVLSPTIKSYCEHMISRVYDTSNHGISQTRRRIICGFCPILHSSRPASLRDILIQCDADFLQGDLQTNGRLVDKEHKRYTTRGLDETGYTVTGCFPVLFNNGRMRRLPNIVCATMQSFPPDYIFFASTKNAVRKMIANAVPPLFAKQLISALVVDGKENGVQCEQPVCISAKNTTVA
jgi:site-specific DNA-cytosine methylase